MTQRYFVAGGAGFIGSHLTRRILAESPDASVVIYDNFSSGKLFHLQEVADHPRLKVVRGDIKDLPALKAAMEGAEVVYHFASNPDIARAVREPDIDFWEGTYLTNNILEAMRQTGVRRLLYASGSGVYGDTGWLETPEDHSPLRPISTYGASKLACEALICSYCHMFDMQAFAFRFANVVGPLQTHGVGYDFIRRLLRDASSLHILGDGTQSKSYIHVADILNALRLLESAGQEQYQVYNVTTPDFLTVTGIADLVQEVMGLRGVEYRYTGGDRGWKGDVPVVRLDCERIKALGWRPQRDSRQAMQDALEHMLVQARAELSGEAG